eukprot:gene16146-19213_t
MTDYVSVASMLTGLVLFAIGDSLSSFSPLGLALVIVYVFMESFKSILYEKILRDFSSEQELSLFVNFFGATMTLPILFVSGEFQSSMVFFKTNLNVLLLLAFFIMLGYYANIAFLHLMRITDAFYANIISSMRKFITIILSFVFFKDSMLSYHILGIVVFFLGLGLEIKHSSKKDKRKL